MTCLLLIRSLSSTSNAVQTLGSRENQVKPTRYLTNIVDDFKKFYGNRGNNPKRRLTLNFYNVSQINFVNLHSLFYFIKHLKLDGEFPLSKFVNYVYDIL